MDYVNSDGVMKENMYDWRLAGKLLKKTGGIGFLRAKVNINCTDISQTTPSNS